MVKRELWTGLIKLERFYRKKIGWVALRVLSPSSCQGRISPIPGLRGSVHRYDYLRYTYYSKRLGLSFSPINISKYSKEIWFFLLKSEVQEKKPRIIIVYKGIRTL